jgi:hypothetical protein
MDDYSNATTLAVYAALVKSRVPLAVVFEVLLFAMPLWIRLETPPSGCDTV